MPIFSFADAGPRAPKKLTRYQKKELAKQKYTDQVRKTWGK